MMRPGNRGRLIAAQNRASLLLASLGIDRPQEVDLEDIAMHLGIDVVAGPLRGAEARLVRRGTRGLIRVREDIPETGRRRFAVAHEIGHWCLHETRSQLQTCLASDLHGYSGSSEELESNSFAAELLMPTRLVRESFNGEERTIDLIRAAAQEMLTTFSATAVRLIETSPDPNLLVFSTNGTVHWWVASRAASGYWLERRQEIAPESVAWAVTEGAPRSKRPQRVAAESWFGHHENCSLLELYEESILLPSYSTVISVLSWIEHYDG